MYRLNNEWLAVTLHEWPGVQEYMFKPSGTRMAGSGPDGRLSINGTETDWSEWDVDVLPSEGGTAITYRLKQRRSKLRLEVEYRLDAQALEVKVTVADDPEASLTKLDWARMPLLTCDDPSFAYDRTEARQKSWKLIPGGGRGLYDRKRVRDRIGDAVPDPVEMPTMHACTFDGSLCCFVQTNYPVLPLLTRVSEDKRYPGRGGRFSIAPGTYQYRVRERTMEPLELAVVFLEDINGDGTADDCDYHLWLNRRFPDADPLYKKAIWYQVFNAEKDRGVLTTFKETLEIIRQIHNVTGGVRQIAYLIGWQFDGHDTGYPSLNRVNPKLAENPDRADEELRELVRRAKEEYDCIVSYHINLDDAYVDAPDWDPAILSRDPDGSDRVWLDTAKQRAYHINHTKDVESGQVFRRIDDFLRTVPVERTVQVDAFRNTNTSWEPDGSIIGPMEELVCGMKPILAYFRERGIDVSTEGLNGMPIEDSGVFSAYWHYSPSMLYHGKIVGGGSVDMNAVAWGKGASFDSDVLYRGEPTRHLGEQFLANDFESKWDQIVDIIYLGSMLYQFYLEREMAEWREDERRIFIRYSDGVKVDIDKVTERLAVRWGQVTIASDGDRFVPNGNRIYAYSRAGADREWTLPVDWRSAEFAAYRMSGNGREGIGEYPAGAESVRLRLEPGVPVILEKRTD
ncbi:endo-alpha-N-acetylgalactosaminidase family protein [Paenibacillus sp. LHD-117]|uniref:endo-alpha-N-acetylgalactosaminidase family protein n=1 Tax=Paenibacillus sp. LHD-117 TaxID=3071412 RepID=UPI0027E0A8B8|nr:endo-alpha-N-acetylgalactosaminidase family protein [Paenibacillus sp. LHD-117]MDQ6421468.1 endo-alpha-N-acetylgalactosaminidase family protein [Paenibacillus sp. LHD-117]